MFWLFLYRIVVTGFFLLFFPFVVIVCLSVPKWKQGLEQKLGFIDQETIYKIRKQRFGDLLDKLKNIQSESQPDQAAKEILNNQKARTIWLHAVSFGEVKTVEPFVYELQKQYPDCNICISTGTLTGQNLAQKTFTDKAQNPKLKKECFVFYCPFDMYFAVKNWFVTIKPDFLIIAETEIWPELLMQAKQSKVETFLINARLTDKSTTTYKLLKPVMSEAMSCFKTIAAQSEDDTKRFIQIGAKEEQIKITGNLKFDSMQKLPNEEIADLKGKLNIHPDTFVLVAGSTHSGEEELACRVLKKLKAEFPEKDLRLIIAPRHLERLKDVETTCLDNDLNFIKKSEFEEGSEFSVLILDTLGELNKFYSQANLVLLGGTWADIGGHNPLEPLAYNIPVLVGKHTYKIQDLMKQLKDKIIFKQSEEEVYEFVCEKLAEKSDNQKEEIQAIQIGGNSISKELCSLLKMRP